MRVVRTILGILLLSIGLPLLLVGGGLWMAMQHRDAGGAYSGQLEEIRTPGYAVVVPDVDALLRRQAPFARSDQTRLRLTARTGSTPAFIGMARPVEAGRFLAGVAHTRIEEVRLARGDLPVRAADVAGEAEPATGPREQRFWLRSGAGSLEWSPAETRGQRLVLVVMSADGQPPGTVSATAEMRPGWLGPSTWGVLVLGSVTLLLGIVCLAWPSRTREIVYVVEPAQLPEVAARLGVHLPGDGADSAGKPAAADRPATLAESAPSGSAPSGSAPSGSAPSGSAPSGSAPSGSAPSGSVPAAWSGPAPPAVPRLSWPPVYGAKVAAAGVSAAGGSAAGVPAAGVPAGGVPAAGGLAGGVPAGSTEDRIGQPVDEAGDDVDDAAGPGPATGDAKPGAARPVEDRRPGASPGSPVPMIGTGAGVVAPRSARRRRANAAAEGAGTEEPIAPTGAGVAAAMAAARRPGRPRGGKGARKDSGTAHEVAAEVAPEMGAEVAPGVAAGTAAEVVLSSKNEAEQPVA